MTNLAPLMSSADPTWRTPDNVLEPVRSIAPIGLDPATDSENPTRANMYYTPATSGLVLGWSGFGLVYCNPPYGRVIGPWVERMAWFGNLHETEVIGLVPARVDTAWWQDNIVTAAAICFWRGRLKFKGAKDAAPFPSALAYWGPRPERFREVFGPHGWIP